MDLRGFPQVSVNNNLKIALNDMYISEAQSRNYIVKSRTPKLYSMNPTLDKYIDNIKNNNNIGLEQLLIEYGNVTDEEGLNPLYIAILCNDVGAVKIILEHQKYVVDDNALAFACENNCELTNLIVTELLKCVNIDVNKKGGSINEIPLYYAINNDKTMETVKTLLKCKKIDLSSPLINGKSVFQYTIFNRKWYICALLLQHTNTKLNKSDLDLIFSEGSVEIIDILLKTNKFTSFKTHLNDYFIKLINRMDIPVEILILLAPFININHRDVFVKLL